MLLLHIRKRLYGFVKRFCRNDGILYFHNIIDNERPDRGISELRSIDPVKITKIRKVEKELKTINGKQIYVIKLITTL